MVQKGEAASEVTSTDVGHESFGAKAVESDNVHLAKVRETMLVPINKLPVELLTHIFLLTNVSGMDENYKHPYVSYTWVCHHWRSVLIQNPTFWTLIRHPCLKPFDHELLRRSKTAKLDLILSKNSIQPPFLSTFLDFFAKDSNYRVRSLWSPNCDEYQIRTDLKNQGFSISSEYPIINAQHTYDGIPNCSSLTRLLPVVLASKDLETLQCTLWEGIPRDHLVLVFNHVRSISLTIDYALARSVLELLQNNIALQSLQFKTIKSFFPQHSSYLVTFPELQFLSLNSPQAMVKFRVPKLSSLNAIWDSSPYDCPIFKTFDFASTRCLYIRGCQSHQGACGSSYCVLMSKERMNCRSLLTTRTDIFSKNGSSDTYSRDCFHLQHAHPGYYYQFKTQLRSLSRSIFPRLTNLTEIYFLFPHTSVDFYNILTKVPSVEKVVVQRGNRLMDLIRLLNNETSLCPRLRHLSFKTYIVPQNLSRYAENVGKRLVDCVQARREGSVIGTHQLEYIILGNCPPIPDTWLEELRKLGTEVVTEKDFESVIRKRKRVGRPEEDFSDIEM